MRRALRIPLALCALALPAGLVAGCGGVPGNAVAEVDGTPIEKSSFDHWMNVAAKSGGQANAEVPQPPDYRECVAQARRNAPRPAEGQPRQTDAQLREQCEQQYEQLRDQVLQLLLSFQWIEGEASDLGIEVSDREVRRAFNQQKEQAFPEAADYRKFLRESGQTEEDILARIRLDLLSNKIQEQVVKGKDRVSAQQVRDYYNRNKQRFATPESRDLRVVLTRNRARAQEAKEALESGESWNSVVREYSIDDTTKAEGGRLEGVQKGTQDQQLEEAVFEAERGELAGPIETTYGWYVFEVTDITEPDQQTLQEATPTIRQVVAQERQQNALNTFLEDFQEKWRDRTECRDPYTTTQCSNGPEPTPTPDPAQQQQQAPQTPAPAPEN